MTLLLWRTLPDRAMLKEAGKWTYLRWLRLFWINFPFIPLMEGHMKVLENFKAKKLNTLNFV